MEKEENDNDVLNKIKEEQEKIIYHINEFENLSIDYNIKGKVSLRHLALSVAVYTCRLLWFFDFDDSFSLYCINSSRCLLSS